MFSINQNKGFTMTFSNDWTVSVQFSEFNYCHNDIDGDDSKEAEIAAWDKNNKWYDFGSDTVQGYCSADEVANFINLIKNKKGV